MNKTILSSYSDTKTRTISMTLCYESTYFNTAGSTDDLKTDTSVFNDFCVLSGSSVCGFYPNTVLFTACLCYVSFVRISFIFLSFQMTMIYILWNLFRNVKQTNGNTTQCLLVLLFWFHGYHLYRWNIYWTYRKWRKKNKIIVVDTLNRIICCLVIL